MKMQQKATLLMAILLALTFAFIACTPADTPEDSEQPQTSDGRVQAQYSDPEDDSTFFFSYMHDLDEDGTEEEIKMNVTDYNTPVLTVGDLKTGFCEADAASYDAAAQFMVCDTSYGGKLIYFFLLGGRNYGFYAHCAYYENGTLSEVLFPEEFFGNLVEDPEPAFIREWIDDDTFELKCIYGGEQATLDIDKEGYEQAFSQQLSAAGEVAFNQILNSYELDESTGDMKAIFVLDDACYHDFAIAYITLKFDREALKLTPDIETLTYELSAGHDFLSMAD